MAASLLAPIAGCQHPPPSAPKPPPVVFSKSYDAQIAAIMKLAREDQWEEAQAQATSLFQADPKNAILARVHVWIDQQVERHRAQTLEHKIRQVDAKNSVFDPTFKSLLKEQRDRGLPPRKDVRDTVDRIEATPYIPNSYERTVREQGPMFDFESTQGRMFKVLEKEVNVHLDNVPLETLLVNLSQSAGINIVADKSIPALKQELSVNLDKVKLMEFLRYLGRNYDLQFQIGDDLVFVVDANDPKRVIEETRFYRLRKGFVLPARIGSTDVSHSESVSNSVTLTADTTQYKKFVNDLAPEIPSLERAISNLFSGKFLVDYERNVVVARGTPEQLDALEKIIREFDKPIQQVLIEARFVTVSKPAFMQLGVLWQTGANPAATRLPADFTGIVNSQNFPQSIAPGGSAAPAVGLGIQETFTAVLGAQDLSATISALEQSGESHTLSAPRLTVLNNRPASINDGKVQYYYDQYDVISSVQAFYTSSSFVPSGKPTQITSGAQLNVMASISGDGNSIVLALNPRVNTDVLLVTYATLGQYNTNGNLQSTFDLNLPQYRTDELATRMVVKSGQTVVMGGVFQRERSTLVESVPVLGNMPFIGTLFRRRTEVDSPRYLLVFVTATIVKDTGEFLVYDDAGATNLAPRSATSALPARAPAATAVTTPPPSR